MIKSAIFPGSFDPFHEGHEFIVKSALKEFELLYIIISWNENKVRTYPFELIFEEIKTKYQDCPNIKILINKNDLTTNMAKKLNCFNIVRGYRNDEDLKYEKELAQKYLLTESRLSFFYYHHPKYKNISSSKVKNMLE